MSLENKYSIQSVIDIFQSEVISAPLKIRAEIGVNLIDAVLAKDGAVTLNGVRYSDLQHAMETINREQASTSNFWQFWTWFDTDRQAWTPIEHLRASIACRDIQSEIRTSDTHPLRIDSLNLPSTKGRIGLTFCPGKKSKGLYGGTWNRDLSKDLTEIQDWGSNTLITLMEDHEFSLLGVPEFIDTLKHSSLNWHHLPIQDMQIPGVQFERQWADIGPHLHQQLIQGHSIVIHCRGGLGRTGLLAARMLVEAGMIPVDSVARVRDVRKNSIETYKQEHYVLTQGWKSV